MSDRPYRKESDVPTARIIERLEELALSIGKTAGKNDWTEFYMRIPADPNHDADLIMMEAARRLREANKEEQVEPREPCECGPASTAAGGTTDGN